MPPKDCPPSRPNAVHVRPKFASKALAKSHRPENLFSPETCPIVGAGQQGELFLKGNQSGLEKLLRLIEKNSSKQIVKELSTIEFIEPITPQFRRNGIEALDILKRSPRGKDGFLTRVRLFDFADEDDQAKLISDFFESCKGRRLSPMLGGYSANSNLHVVECRHVDDVEELSRVVGVRSISRMPIVRTIRPRMFKAAALPKDPPSAPDLQEDFPLVAVVDSGVRNDDPALESWVRARDSDVAPEYRNTEHGTAVAGLICWGSQLNPGVQGINAEPCGVIDLQVVPNDDPTQGDTDEVTEAEFLQSLDTWLKRYANQCKVWNISLGVDEVCSLDAFSPLAEELDNLQEKYQVNFVISSGNYETAPLLDYPRKPGQLNIGRITSPADSILGVTVGSIAHVDSKSGPEAHHPSPFSRHGAGPNHVIKPDLVHYGGTCSTDASTLTGIRSLGQGQSGEYLGTSFAAPLVSRSLAQVIHMMTPTPSPVLARALLTHHARDPRNGGRVPDGEENYLGFGLPAPPPYCLECSPHTATLVFEDTLRPNYFLEWDDFPYPPSLRRNGRYFGEVWMTIAFSPSRGSRWGTEYCETHIDTHFGVYFKQKSKTTGVLSEKFKGLVPPEHKNPGQLYESFQIEGLRKWAPVRTYHGNLGEKGERGDRWRLKVQLLSRHGIEKMSPESKEVFRPQPFALIVTIADPERKIHVYDEMSQLVSSRFQAQNLMLRSAARLRAQT